MEPITLLVVVIFLQFGYIVFLNMMNLQERKEFYRRYDRLTGIPEPTAERPVTKGKNPIHKAVDPELEEKLKRDGIYN